MNHHAQHLLYFETLFFILTVHVCDYRLYGFVHGTMPMEAKQGFGSLAPGATSDCESPKTDDRHLTLVGT